MLLVFEALVAAPFWVAAHAVASQSNQGGLSTQFTGRGYMLVLSLFAYPVLSVIGLVFGSVVMYYCALYLTRAYVPFVEGLHIGSTMGAISLLATFIMFVAVVLACAHKAYTLCYELPHSVLRWVGGEHSPLAGEQSLEREGSTAILAAYGRTQHISTSVGQAVAGPRGGLAARGGGAGKKGPGGGGAPAGGGRGQLLSKG